MNSAQTSDATRTGGSPQGPVSRQISLPWSKSVDITFKNFRIRFFRSLITVISLVLAVFFLAFVLVNADVAQGLLDRGGPAAIEQLNAAGYDVSAGAESQLTSAKERWIVILSLLVCTVGIINAQLISVTERFREIGIMKCLGALDSMVLRLFVLESVFQGLAGAGAGALLGFVFAMLQGLIRFGFISWTTLSLAEAGISVLFSIGVGCVLSVVGVLYPAFIAARMQPVQAMAAEH